MRRNQERLLWMVVAILGVLISSPALLGQASQDSKAAKSLPTDWSHHHLIFSRAGTARQSERVQQDPRYWQQIARQSPARLPGTEPGSAAAESRLGASYAGNNQKFSGDWSQDIGDTATVGAGKYPAKYAFRPTEVSCANDFVVYATGLFSTHTQASIVAYNNLYSGCTAPVPAVYWAYNTNGGAIRTSPVFSSDGSQVAFVKTNGALHGVLVLLKWAASNSETVGNPMSLFPVSGPAAYLGCTAPCMVTWNLTNGSGAPDSDTNSSVFYDYGHDTAYVGDDQGWLHKFTPVFNGVLAEVRTGGWPVQVNPGSPTALTSPVYDSVSENVFVADIGGFLYQVDSSAAVTQSGQLDFSSEYDSGPGIVDGPIVDPTSGFVYVFATSDGSLSCIGGSDCTAVYQLTTSFLAGDTGSEAVVGASTVEPTTPSPLYIGAFDSAYEKSGNATGDLYVCGNTGGSPVLYQVQYSAGAFVTVIPGPLLSTSASIPCSPVTDILNPNASGGSTEWIFASAENGGVSSICASGGCVFNFKDKPWLPSTAYALGQEVLDSHFQIQVVTKAGTSGATAPGWQTIPGKITTDNGVHWINQGVQSALTLPAWVADNSYTKSVSKILDVNNNIELVTAYTTHTATCTSGGTLPTFNPTPGMTTTDGTCIWTNLGGLATAAMAAAGGTSGIIIDNTVGSGTLAGASQVYFSTLSGGCGGTHNADGCAVQASQSALQ